jgi:ribosomal-protein-alanine N-acetyltransferase
MRAAPLSELNFGSWRIRPHRDADLPALVRHGDSAKVAAHMRDRFPHPYTFAAGRAWLDLVAELDPMLSFALAERDSDELIGGIGLHPLSDVHRIDAELGYWLGEAHWGQGIATGAVRVLCPWAFDNLPWLERIHACVYASNPASGRVLEKAGFSFEGRLRRSVIKRGQLLDQLIYSLLRDDPLRDDPPSAPR